MKSHVLSEIYYFFVIIAYQEKKNAFAYFDRSLKIFTWYDEEILPDWFRTSSLIFSTCWDDGILGMPKINPLQPIQCPNQLQK